VRKIIPNSANQNGIGRFPDFSSPLKSLACETNWSICSDSTYWSSGFSQMIHTPKQDSLLQLFMKTQEKYHGHSYSVTGWWSYLLAFLLVITVVQQPGSSFLNTRSQELGLALSLRVTLLCHSMCGSNPSRSLYYYLTLSLSLSPFLSADLGAAVRVELHGVFSYLNACCMTAVLRHTLHQLCRVSTTAASRTITTASTSRIIGCIVAFNITYSFIPWSLHGEINVHFNKSRPMHHIYAIN